MDNFKRLLFTHLVAVIVLGLFLGLHPPIDQYYKLTGDRNENLSAKQLGNSE